jgi:predicted permease
MFRDVRLAFRMLRSWRFGAVAAVLTLAIGIGTASSMYALVRMALASTIPDVEDLPSLGRIYASSRTLGVERAQLTLKDADVLAASSSFESVGAYSSDESEMTAGGEPVSISAGEVSEGFFAAMRAHAAAGRLPSADEVHAGAAIAVVSDAVWRKHFAGRSLDDAAVTIDGTPRTIVGVLQPGFGFSFIGISADVWIPMTRTANALERRVSILVRLKPGVTWTSASAELDALARPQNPNGLWTWRAITVEQDVKTRTVGGFAMMFGPALIVLLIGCTNVACMLLARGIDRDVELSVRSALGASRGRIASQLLAESLALALTGGTLGIAMAYAVLRGVAAALAQFRPQTAELVPANIVTLLPVAFVCTVVACVLFGLIPAIRLSRRDIATSLKGGTMPAVARFVGYRARDLVVFVELGAAVALVVTTAMFVRFFAEMRTIKPLFPAEAIVRVDVQGGHAFAALERVAALPGVRGVTLSSSSPGGQRTSKAALISTSNGRSTRAMTVDVQSSFFDVMGIPVLRGRAFGKLETGVVVVSEAAGERLYPDVDPLGQRITVNEGPHAATLSVIGVARNALHAPGFIRMGLMAPEIYLPLPAGDAELVLFARAATDARVLLKPIAAAVRVSPADRLPRAEVLSNSGMVPPDRTFVIKLFGGFGLIAMLLAASGIFGVISQSVAQRTTEFGVRMAMGASASQVLRMVLVREAKLIGVAAATGIVGTVLVTRSAFAEMLAITGSDPRMWAAVAVLCGGLAAVAVALATYRIVRLDPWVVLRQS